MAQGLANIGFKEMTEDMDPSVEAPGFSPVNWGVTEERL